MPISPEQHTLCTRNNSSEVLNTFTNNIGIQRSSNDSSSINPFIIDVEERAIWVPPTKSSIPPEKLVNIEPSMDNINDGSVNICANTNNSIIHMNDESTTTVEDKASKLKLYTKVFYKKTKATITEILPKDDDFLEPVYKIVNWLGKSKRVKHHDIILDLLTIPSDISFATRASNENTNNSFDASDTNSFIKSNSK